MGNKFLANIRETEAVAHVVRCFEDEEVVHVAGKVSPKEDIETINTELALADLETIEKISDKHTGWRIRETLLQKSCCPQCLV